MILFPRRLLIIFFITALPATPLAAQPADTTTISTEPLFTWGDAWWAGGFVLGTIALAPLDIRIAAELQDASRQTNPPLRNAAAGFRVLGFPGSLIIASSLYAVGRAADQPTVADLGLHTTEAIVLGNGINFLIKGLAGRARPYVNVDDPFNFHFARGFTRDRYRSFPSGHTVAAFAAAAAMTTEITRDNPEIKWWVGSLFYGSATLVGVSRIYNNKHWASDVVMGAAIGSFSGWKVVGYNHSHPGNRVDNLLLGVTIPTGGGRGMGLPVVWVAPAR